MNNTEIILREDGKIVERTVSERQLKVHDQILDALAEDVRHPLRQVMEIPGWGMAHASVGRYDTLWSVPIDRIPLHARFSLVNSVLVPKFASSTDLIMPMVWQAPPDVRLVFATLTMVDGHMQLISNNYLFAYNANGNGFRLPLPNLHDDCKICMGEFQSLYPSAYQAVTASLNQFNQSKWNADLMRTIEESQKFFRFKPTNEAFETLPIMAADWTTLCDKVATAIMERVIL